MVACEPVELSARVRISVAALFKYFSFKITIMNLNYLNESFESMRAPFEIADDWIENDLKYKEMVREGVITREDVALFWGLQKASSECVHAPILNPPIDVRKAEDEEAYNLLAQRLECDRTELKKRIIDYIGRITTYHNQKVEKSEVYF